MFRQVIGSARFNPPLDRNRQFRFGRQGTIGRFERAPELRPAIFVDTGRREPVGDMLTPHDERAVALDRAAQRPQLTPELHLVEHNARAARRV